MTSPTLLNLPDSVNRDLQDICEAWGRDREFVITSLIGRLKRGEWGPDGWQPIETAPQMKTLILFAITDIAEDGHVKNWKMATGFWSTGHNNWLWDGHPLNVWDVTPTHWQLLPAPPEQS